MTTTRRPQSSMALIAGSMALVALLALPVQAVAADEDKDGHRHGVKALRVLLIGDSTMATKSGYGDALCARFRPEVRCLNLARGGRSSKSFRAEGLWDQAMALLRERPAGQRDLVLIQFGHNDQPGKPGRSTDLATEFPVNMAGYVQELKAVGADLVLVTPLTRRGFDAQGRVGNDLRPWAEATQRIAAQAHVPLLDLNASSHAAVQAMGEAEADTLAMAPRPIDAPAQPNGGSERAGASNPAFDRTHLGAKGAAVFGDMVFEQLLVIDPTLRRWAR